VGALFTSLYTVGYMHGYMASLSGDTSPSIMKHTTDLNLDIGRNSDYKLADEESFGFFGDISSAEWEKLRGITLSRANNEGPITPLALMAWKNRPATFYQNFWDPDFSCRHDTKIGLGDGGKWVCDPHRIVAQSRKRMEADSGQNVSAGCLVYSIGSNGNFQFEKGVNKVLGPGICETHTFDFTNFAHKVPAGKGITFHHWGLKPSYQETMGTSHNGSFEQSTARGTFKTLKETQKELGHEGRPIDIFKIDCEGCEWATYKDWLETDIRQILVEMHMVPQVAVNFFSDFQRAGYVTFHKEPNIEYGGGVCVEYAMLKLSKKFLENKN
jgi:hypothetical protein